MYGPFGVIERLANDTESTVFCVGSTTDCQPRPSHSTGDHSSLPRTDKSEELSSIAVPRPAVGVSLVLTRLRWLNGQIEAQLRAWRWGRPVSSWSLLVVAMLAWTQTAVAAEPNVRFDVPALMAVTAKPSAESGDLQIVRLKIPVTTEIASADRQHWDEFRYNVQWRNARYPVTEFSPMTATTSTIDGNIAIETNRDRNATFGLNVNGGQYLPPIGGAAKAEANSHDGKKIRYNEVPQHDVLVASGTVDRGTGVFFRFQRSRKETLEGSRELQVAFRVPADWTVGFVKVECRASGNRKVIGLWNEPLEMSRSFVVPVYLHGNVVARQRAVNFVRSQRIVRPRATSASRVNSPANFESVVKGLLGATR